MAKPMTPQQKFINLIEKDMKKIKSITPIDYSGDTYNLHVKDNHNYFAEGLNISNCHRFSSEVTSEIVSKTTNAKYKFGFTGTLPDDKSKMMTLIGLFGNIKTHIRTQELIELGLGTPLKVNSIILQYPEAIKNQIKKLKQFPSQFKFIREYEPRTNFITNLSTKLKGNTLVLFSMTDHGKDLFTKIFLKKYPEFEGREKELLITGKKSYDFQKDYGVYFINGEDDAKTRELTRKVLEEPIKKITFENGSWIRVPEDLELPLSNGGHKKVKDLSEGDDINEDELLLFCSENGIKVFI